MKKRVISFLLSITMLVAAIPVTTISSAAADKLTTITAPDIFKTNEDGKLILAPNIVAAPEDNLTILDAAAILVGVLRPTAKVENKNAIGLTDKTKGIFERVVGMGIFSATAKTNVNARLSLKGAYTVLDRVFKFTEEQKGLANSVSPEVLKGGITVAEFIAAVDVFAGTILNGKGTYTANSFDTKNVTITKSGITLENATIEGKLTIADGVGDGDVTIKDVTVKGGTLARGCGKNTFKMLGSSSTKELIAANMNHAFRVFAESAQAIMDMIIASGHNGVTVDAACENITSYTTAPVLVTKDAKNVVAAAKDADITIGSAARVGVLSSAAAATGATLTVQGAVDALNAAAPDTGVKALNGAKLGLVTTETTATGTTVSAAKGSVIKDLKANAANTAVVGSGDVISATINGNNVSIGTGSTKVIVAAGVKDTTVGNNPVNGGTNIVSPVAPTAPDDLPTGEITTQGDGTTAPAVTTAAVTTAAETQIPVAPPALVSETLLYLEAPRAGGTPETHVASATQYGSEVTWKGADGTTPVTFEKGIVYTATITLTAKSIYSFDGMAASRFSVNGIPASGSEKGVSGAITFNFTFPTTKAITMSTELFAQTPVAGRAWFRDFETADDAKYVYLYNVKDPDGNVLKDNEIYKPSTAYTAIFKLFAVDGTSFLGLEASDFTVNGNTATKTVKIDETEATIEYTFPKTEAQNAPIEMVSDKYFYLSLPVAGETVASMLYPSSMYVCTSIGYYNGDVLVEAPDTFDESTTYTAKIALKARPGYTFIGVKATDFKVSGSAVTDTAVGTADGLTFSFTCPKTGIIKPITGGNIEITAPVAGRRVNNNVKEVSQYDVNSFVWKDVVHDNKRIAYPAIFAENTKYSATIVLEADEGFIFANNSFTVNNEPVEAKLDETGTIATITKEYTTAAAPTLTKVTDTNLKIGNFIVGQSLSNYSCSEFTAQLLLVDKNGYVDNNIPSNIVTDYTIKIKLFAEPGFTFAGMTASDFKVNGKTITDTAIGTDKEMIISLSEQHAVKATPVTEKNINVYEPKAGEYIPSSLGYEGNIIYTYTFTKHGKETSFNENSDYELKLSMFPAFGYTFEGIAPTEFKINGALVPTIVTSDKNSITLTYTFHTGDIVTKQVTDTELFFSAPVAGKTIDITTSNFEYDSVILWSNSKGEIIFPDEPFVKGETYTADVLLTTYPAHTFTGLTAKNFTVNGNPVIVDSDPIDEKNIVITYTFPPAGEPVLEELQHTNINAYDIFVGGTIEGAYFANDDLYLTDPTWTKNGAPLTVDATTKFEADVLYTVTFNASITEESKDIYTLKGLGATEFTVNGYSQNITVHHLPNGSINFTYEFPKLRAIQIADDTAIDILPPVAGRDFITSSVFDGFTYEDAITWATDGAIITDKKAKAAVGKVYTATVVLTAHTGYTFTGANPSKFVVNGELATATIAPDGTTATLTYEFPVTTPTLLDEITDTNVIIDVPTTGEVILARAPWDASYEHEAEYVWKVNETEVIGSFLPNTTYTVVITLTPKNGYTFANVLAPSFTVNGTAPTKATVDATDTATITYTFPATT